MLSPSQSYESEDMLLAKMYILNNLEYPPTIAKIAKHVCQSESSLKRKFKSTYGVPVYHFIQHSRIMKAKDLLETQQYNVTEVAYQIGYTNTSHFSKAFKKFIGMNPREYLRSYKIKK